MLNTIAQIIGIAGLIFAIITFQNNSHKGILFYQIIATIFFTIHFSLIGAFTGAAMNLLGGARNAVFYHRDKKWANSKIWLYIFLTIYIIAGILTWKNIYSILPVTAMVVSTVGVWIKNPKLTRFIVLPTSPCWLIYNLVSSSYAGVLAEIFIFSSIIAAIIRFDFLKKGKELKVLVKVSD